MDFEFICGTPYPGWKFGPHGGSQTLSQVSLVSLGSLGALNRGIQVGQLGAKGLGR